MKLFGDVFYAFAVLAFIGPALSDGESGDVGSQTTEGAPSEPGDAVSNVPATRVCPSKADDDKEPVYTVAAELADYCIKKELNTENTRFFSTSRTKGIDGYRSFFKDFCQKQEVIRTCFSEVSLNLEVCDNKSRVKTVQVIRDMFETLMESGCRHVGERHAYLFHEFIEVLKDNGRNESFYVCVYKSYRILNSIQNGDVDASSKLFLAHSEIAAFKTCVSMLEIDDTFKTALWSVLDEMVTEMKCIHPQDGTLVLCRTIDPNSLTTPSVCLVMPTSAAESSIYDKLEGNTGRCYGQLIEYDDEKNEAAKNITDLQEKNSLFCSYDRIHLRCDIYVEMLAEKCLNDTEHTEWKVVKDGMKDALDIGCLEDGARIADIMFEVYRLKRTSNETADAVSECISIAKSTRKQNHSEESSSLSLRFYRELEAFKECFLNKLHGDNTAVKAAESLMNDILRMVKCVHPGDGTTVLCKNNSQ